MAIGYKTTFSIMNDKNTKLKSNTPMKSVMMRNKFEKPKNKNYKSTMLICKKKLAASNKRPSAPSSTCARQYTEQTCQACEA